jgi:hypothetical protein
MHGNRIFNIEGKSAAFDLKNKLFAETLFNNNNPGLFGKRQCRDDFFKGGIYKINDKFK